MPVLLGAGGGRPSSPAGYGRNYTAYDYDAPMCAAADQMGCPPWLNLTSKTLSTLVITGAASLTAAGLTYTGSGTEADPWIVMFYDIQLTGGVFKIECDFVEFHFCKLHTSWAGTGDSGVIDTTNTGVSHTADQVRAYKCDVYCDTVNFWLDGFFGHGWTSSYCNVYHVVDCFGSQVAYGSGLQVSAVTIDHSWGHDMMFVNGEKVPLSNYSGSGGSPGNGSTGGPNNDGIVNAGGNSEKPDGCLAAETLVRTDDGDIPIRSLVGTHPRVLTENGWLRASIKSYGVQALHAVTLESDGVTKVVHTTAPHRWYLADYTQVRTETLQPGMLIPRVGKGSHWTVISVEATDRVEEVYCAEVPRFRRFVIDGDVLTGNSHNDVWQPQNGSGNVCQYSILDGRLDSSVDVNGVRHWMRYSTTDLTTADGNSYGPPWGTFNANSAIQFNNVTQTAPVTDNLIRFNWLIGGREAMFNIASDAWNSSTGTYTNTQFYGNIFCDDIGPSGTTTPPQGVTGLPANASPGMGLYGYNASATPYTAFQLPSETAGWQIILGGNYTSAFTTSATYPNILHSTGAPVPWNNPSSPYMTG